ncbi:MAG: DNA alkylation repair protein [Kofleriaceae bacterium]
MVKARVPLDPVADLKRRLNRQATERARAFWERQLRGRGRYRGVSMPKVRACVQTWWDDHLLAHTPASVGKRIALALIEQSMIEDKLAGILVLQDKLGDQLRATDLTAFARLFAAGHLAEFNAVDWFAVRVLVTLLEHEAGRADAVRVISQWRGADSIWQRRASCLAFTGLAALGEEAMPGLTSIILTVCATVVWSHERFDQTAVGWVLRELSLSEPARVEMFFRTHARFMSKECARSAVEKLPAARRTELLAHHKRATTIRRL